MPDAIFTVLRLIFLALIYLFLWQVTRAISAYLGLSTGERRRRPGRRMVIVKSETQAGTGFRVTNTVVLGRGEDADIRLDDPYASDFHFRLMVKEGKLVLTDLGSTNGTYVNGRRVTAPVELQRGDAVQVGKTIMEVK